MWIRPVMITIIMVLPAYQLDNKIEFKQLYDNPGILPFKLGETRIQRSQHTFIHNYPLIPLRDHFNNLNVCLIQLTNRHKELILEKVWENEITVELITTEQVRNELLKIHPDILKDKSRSKRGLVNILGSVFKFISGNLDAQDGERYDNAIRSLAQNQQDIVQHFNKQISLNNELVQEYIQIFKNISENFKVLNSTIQLIGVQQLKHTIMLLKINILDYQQLIQNLQTALSFAQLNILHLSIITEKQVEIMRNQLSTFHSDTEFYSKDSILFERTITVDFYITDEHIVFLLHVPILDRDTFTLYHMYSIPTPVDTVIISPTPYIALSNNLNNKEIYYLKEPCIFLQQQFYCPNNKIEKNYQEDNCIKNLLQIKTHAQCIHVNVNITNILIESINDERDILILPEKTLIHEKCKHEEVHNLQGVYYARVTYSCSFIANDFTYANFDSTLPEAPVYSPMITFPSSYVKPIQFNLKSIKLDQLSKLTLELKKTATATFVLEGNTHIFSYSIIIIITVIIICYLCYKNSCVKPLNDF